MSDSRCGFVNYPTRRGNHPGSGPRGHRRRPHVRYLLTTHPDIQARFRAELDEVLGGKTPTPEDLSRLTFTERILTESMRLYPPI